MGHSTIEICCMVPAIPIEPDVSHSEETQRRRKLFVVLSKEYVNA